MARRIKRHPSKLWRNIKFKITWIRTKWTGCTSTKGCDTHDSAEYFPKACINDVLTGLKMWGVDEGFEHDVEFLAFEEFSDIWPKDGGHKWCRDSPMTTVCPLDRAIWYRCKNCSATGKRIGGPEIPVVRCTGEKVCPQWRRRAQR